MNVSVLVPADRIGAFQVALGTFCASKSFPIGSAGSTGDEWRRVSAEISPDDVGAFYREFARWLGETTTAEPDLPDLDQAILAACWDQLPAYEQEFLRLLADDFGRPVGWVELRDKLGLAGEPDLARDLPVLTAALDDGRRMPVRVEGDVLWLPSELVDLVRDVSTAA